jgi:hypothetical protein
MARAFFRIVQTNPPTRWDLLSNQVRRGDPRPGLPVEIRNLWDGLSVHATEEQSRRQARKHPPLGACIAELHIPEEASGAVRWQRTIPRNSGHYTVWCDPDALLGYAVRVIPVEE